MKRVIYFDSESLMGKLIVRLFYKIHNKRWNLIEEFGYGYLDEFTSAYYHHIEEGRFTYRNSDELFDEFTIRIPSNFIYHKNLELTVVCG